MHAAAAPVGVGGLRPHHGGQSGEAIPDPVRAPAEGEVTLTSINLLAAHLTDDNHESLLDAARQASRRDVERLVASLHQQPDIPASVRRVPGAASRERHAGAPEPTNVPRVALLIGSETASPLPVPVSAVHPSPSLARAAARQAVAPLAADRYLLRLTIDASTHAKLERARDLLRHTIPHGDPAFIIDRALTVLVEQLEKRKAGRLSRPEGGVSAMGARSTTRRTRSSAKRLRRRHVPAAVKRAVWTRDDT